MVGLLLIVPMANTGNVWRMPVFLSPVDCLMLGPERSQYMVRVILDDIVGKWALPVWFICGLVAFGVFVAGGKHFTPDLAQRPTDWVMWVLDASLFLLCVLGGPLATIAALLLVFMVAFFTRLI
jgi:hypothetical protein